MINFEKKFLALCKQTHSKFIFKSFLQTPVFLLKKYLTILQTFYYISGVNRLLYYKTSFCSIAIENVPLKITLTSHVHVIFGDITISFNEIDFLQRYPHVYVTEYLLLRRILR